jgi:hypothetical protein
VAPELRERFFGAALELTTHDNYCPAWAADKADAGARPGGDGESVRDVAARVLGLLQVRGRAGAACGPLLLFVPGTLRRLPPWIVVQALNISNGVYCSASPSACFHAWGRVR